jgi:hypothetical protein
MTGAADVDLGAEVAAVEMEDERADVATDVEHSRPTHRRSVLVIGPVVVRVPAPVRRAQTDNGSTS